MALDKNDLKQIEKIVDKRVGQSEKTITKKLEGKIQEAVDKGVEVLAGMTKRGFDEQGKKINEIKKEVKLLRGNQISHDFRMGEMVHKAEYYKLDERLTRVEEKVGLKK